MKLTLGCSLTYLAKTETPVITLLKLRKEVESSISKSVFEVIPKMEVNEYLDFYGNYCQRFLIPKGFFSLKTTFEIKVEDRLTIPSKTEIALIQDLPQSTLIYLLASRYCESDKLNATSLGILKKEENAYQTVENIRLWVHQNIKYQYSVSTSSTSALDTLAQKKGVCRDLSHLAISLCRSINIPARFVVGYLYDLKPMDLHAWFEAFIDGQWITFDATQPITTAIRAILAYGRDAADVATATYFGDMKLEKMLVFVDKVE